MLDIKYLRKNVAEATRRLQDRGIESEKLTTLLSLDKARREAIREQVAAEKQYSPAPQAEKMGMPARPKNPQQKPELW